YLTGRRSFMGIELLAAPGTLVPRQETELLGETALRLLKEKLPTTGKPRLIDMCCGSGNLACALAVKLPDAQVWASDLMESCVELSRRNIEHLRLGDRVEVLQGDLFAAFARLEFEHSMDMIVCNPPYISTGRLSKD